MGRRRSISVVVLFALIVGALVAVPSSPASAAPPTVTFTNHPDSAIRYPNSIALGSDGALWFTNASGNSIGRLNPTTGVITNYTGPGISYPFDITAGPGNTLWFTNQQGDSIGRITTAGVVTDFSDPLVSGPEGITFGPDGNIWFASSGNDSIGRITPGGSVSQFTHPSIDFPEGITTGPDGALWFMNNDGNTLGRITTSGVVTTFTDGVSITGPSGITTGPDGQLWFTNNDSLGSYDPVNDVFQEYSGPGIAHPFRIVTGPDGALWYTNNDGSIGRITTSGSFGDFGDPTIAQPSGIAVQGGALWFTNRSNNSIGRITTAGVVTNNPGTNMDQIQGITQGPDGARWFTSRGTDSIGRITNAGVITNFRGPQIVQPWDITTGADGALWFTNASGSGSIGRITTAGLLSQYPTGTVLPWNITAGPDGALWFVNLGDSSIGRITTAGVVTTFSDPVVSGAIDITTGPDGALWFAGSGNDVIGRVTTSGVFSSFTAPSVQSPQGIALGADGALWFTNWNNNSIGRITGAGVITSYSAPSVVSPTAITLGPDDAMWFTNMNNASVGRITTAGVINNYTAPGLTVPAAITRAPDGKLWVANAFSEPSIFDLAISTASEPTSVEIKAPNGFSPANRVDEATKFTSNVTAASGTTISSVAYKVDGIAVGTPTAKPYKVTVDPVDLGLSAGTHTLTATATDSNGGQSTDSIVFTVPTATLSLGPSPLAPEGATVTPGAGLHAGWTIPVENTSGETATNVLVTLHATRNGNPVAFDTGVMQGCQGNVTQVVCPLGSIAPFSTKLVPALVVTQGDSDGTVFAGDASVSAANSASPAPITLDTITVVVPPPGVAQVISVVSPATPKTATLMNTKAAVTPNNPQSITVKIPRKVKASSVGAGGGASAFSALAVGGGAASAKTVAPPPVSISIFPADGGSADTVLCQSGCLGKLANVIGNFSNYRDKVHPIKLVIKTFLANRTKTNAGQLAMRKENGTVVQLSGSGGRPCVKTAAGYNTPCAFKAPKIKAVKASGSSPAGVTVQDTVYFTGEDPKFGRR